MFQLCMLLLKKTFLICKWKKYWYSCTNWKGVTNAVPFHEDVMIEEDISTLEIGGKNLTDYVRLILK